MKAATCKLRSPLKWHGGKSYLARRIVAEMPEHATYVEPFLGGGSVLLNKPRAEVEVAGDLDPDLVAFWEDFRCRHRLLAGIWAGIPYTEDAFERSRRRDDPGRRPTSIDFLVRNRFSRGGLGEDFAWSDRLRGGKPGDANAWDTIRAGLPAIADRIRDVGFRCVDATALIDEFDSPSSLIYCDPPYVHGTRTRRAAYRHEMDDRAHHHLLCRLRRSKAHVILSGYRHPMYDELLAGWRRVEFDMPNHSSQARTKQRRTECLWINEAA